MEFEKEWGKKISFNLSPSSINVYYQSPLLFYLKYIAKVPDDTSVPVCYGLSGSIVHECLEKYAKKEGYIGLITKKEDIEMINLIKKRGYIQGDKFIYFHKNLV